MSTIPGLSDDEMKQIEEALVPGLHMRLEDLGRALEKAPNRKGALEELVEFAKKKFGEGGAAEEKGGEEEGEESEKDED